MNEETTALATRPATELTTYTGDSPAVLYQRLEMMRAQRELIHDFLGAVMIKGQDYGTIADLAGTAAKKDEKAVLFKAGAEKLCELYGYAPTLVSLTEVPEYDTGHLRVSVVVGLVRKGDGVKVAEGVGECSTRESKYAYRWLGERYALEIVGGKRELLAEFKSRTRGARGSEYTQYRVPNEDLHDVWNTILKMAKKRALVDATLTATSASGVFAQAAQELDEWVEGDFTEVPGPAQSAPDNIPSAPAAPRQAQKAREQAQEPVTPAREPKSGSEWLNALEAKYNLDAKKQGIAVLSRVFGTDQPLKLTNDQSKLFIRMLQVRYEQTPHDHLADAKIGPTGEYYCGACGEGIDARAVEGDVDDDTPSPFAGELSEEDELEESE